MKRKTLVSVLCLFAASLLSFGQVAEAQAISAYGDDTISGFSTVLRSSPVIPGTRVDFRVIKPGGATYETNSIASNDGVANVELPAFHTRIAGSYEVSASALDIEYGEPFGFNVLSGEVSASQSSVSPLDQVVRMGGNAGRIEVLLYDLYENPIDGHLVDLISSRDGDSIQAISKITDLDGKASFAVMSTDPGVSTYTVYDLTSNKTLSDRAKVVYFDSSDDLFSSSLQAMTANAIGAASGPTAYLGFEDVVSSATVGQSVTFTVNAYDASGSSVTDFGETVHFSVVEGNAAAVNLPVDYTFVPEDLGAHAFALGASFNTSGTYVVKAEDLVDASIYGTTQVKVAESSLPQASQVELTNPQAGSYSNNIHVIAGETESNKDVVFYDNGEVIGNTVSSVSGEFIFTTGLLADGVHEIYAAITDEADAVLASSDKVSITIDTSKPEIFGMSLDPSTGISGGSQFKIGMTSETALSGITVGFDGSTFNLIEEESGSYSATLTAPNNAGTYDLVLKLSDALGNELVSNGEYSVNVGAATGGGAIGEVGGLKAYPSDHQVNLTWNKPTSGEVSFYRIYYGIDRDQLKFVIDTLGTDTKWYIPSLKNSTEYYFAVVAVDSIGNISPKMSNIVYAIPGEVTTPLPPEVVAGTAGAADLESMDSDVSDTGPEVLWLILAAVLGGFFYSMFGTSKVAEEIENC